MTESNGSRGAASLCDEREHDDQPFAFISEWHEPVLVRIESDFEECSSALVCRYIAQHHHIHCYPLRNSRYFYMASCGKPNLAQAVQKNTGLTIAIDCAAPEMDEDAGIVSFSFQQAILFLFYHYCLLHPRFQVAASPTMENDTEYYELQFGSFSSKGICTYGFERCVLTSTCEGLIYLQIQYYRVKPMVAPLLEKPRPAPRKKRSSSLDIFDDLDNLSDGEDDSSDSQDYSPIENEFDKVTTDQKALSLPTGQFVVVNGQFAISSHAKNISKELLSPHDIQQRRSGHRCFLPDSFSKFQLYWSCAYGTDFSSSSDLISLKVARICDGRYEKVVPACSLVRSMAEVMIPQDDVIQQASIELGELLKTVPFVRSVGEVISSTAMQERHKHEMLDKVKDIVEPKACTTSSIFFKASASREKKNNGKKVTYQPDGKGSNAPLSSQKIEANKRAPNKKRRT